MERQLLYTGNCLQLQAHIEFYFADFKTLHFVRNIYLGIYTYTYIHTYNTYIAIWSDFLTDESAFCTDCTLHILFPVKRRVK